MGPVWLTCDTTPHTPTLLHARARARACVCACATRSQAENAGPGLDGGRCTEIDLLEANNQAMQSAIHTQAGGAFGSGNCDKNGCFARVGGPQAPPALQGSYGRAPGATINGMRPFEVAAAVDGAGALTVQFSQGQGADEQVVTTFDKRMAGVRLCPKRFATHTHTHSRARARARAHTLVSHSKSSKCSSTTPKGQ